MRHNDHEIDKLFREKLQQQQEHHSFDKENDWSKLALSLSVSGLVRTGVMSLGAKIFSYAAKTLFIGVMAFVPSLTQSVVSLNSDKNFIAKNSSDKNNIDNTLAQRNQTENLAENSVKSSSDNDFNTKNSFGNNIFDAFLGKNLAEKNTENPLNDKLENSKENSIQNIENQTVTSKENKDLEDDLVTKDKSFIKTQTTLNQTVTSKEKELLVKTQTTAKENSIQNIENQTVTSKEGENLEDNLVAKDKSFIKTQTTLKQTVTSKEKE